MHDRTRHQGPAASHLLVLAALTVTVLGDMAPACAEEKTNPLGSMFGLFGAQPEKDQDAIDYRPRAPLVVPPTRDLPEPKEAVRDPAWPKDTDSSTRRRAALDSRRPAPQTNAGEQPVAKPPQTSQAEPAKPDPHEGECLLNDTGPQSCVQAPWKFLQTTFGGGSSDTTQQPGVEPVRKVLTEPPAGYRTATIVPKTAEDKAKDESQAGGIGSFLQVFGLDKSSDK